MSSSGSSSSSDSESDDESGPIAPNPTDTSDKKLTLVDDEDSGLVLNLPPENDGEGPFEEEGEGEGGESGVDAQSEKKSIAASESESDKPKKKKKKKKKWLYCCTISCKYDSVRRCTKRYGFKEIGEDEDWNLYWTDYSVALERVMDMKKYQKINHFPGMSEICRKDLLARNMNRMLRLFPKEYNVFPRSWCLPADYGDFQAYSRQKKHKTYILKPESGCQGKGIWVTKNTKDIKPNEHMLCQQYVSRPFLIDGFKFDLRIYTLVTSCDPLRIFLFKDGLARFATAKYVEPHHHNVDNVFMHLTNYAINKNSSDFIRDDEGGSKRRISTINKWFRENGYDVDRMWNDIDDVIIKTLISAHAVLKHNYRTCFPNHVKGSACFEILGFDVMIDKKGKPYLIEVNHSPSFHTDAKLDKEIKEAMLYDTLNLVNFGAIDKKKCIEEEKRKIKERLFQRQNKRETKEEFDKAQTAWLETITKYEDSHMGNFRRIYPGPNTDAKYEKYFHSSGSLYQETAAFKARSECARQQREEILRKQEKMEMMLKKKKNELRPESPGSRRRKAKKGTLPLRRYSTARGLETVEVVVEVVTKKKTKKKKKSKAKHSKTKKCGRQRSDITESDEEVEPYQSLSGSKSDELDLYDPIDTKEPLDIVEEEELERISGLLQRDNLVRGLGIVEHVYRLLHCTPGTMSVQLKPSDKYHSHHHHNHHHHERDSQALHPMHDPYSGQGVTNNYSYNNSNLGTLHTTYNHALSRTVYAQGQGAYIGGQPGQMWKTARQTSGLAQVNDRGLQRHGSQRYSGGRQQNGRGGSYQLDERQQLTFLDVDSDPRGKLVYGRHGYEPRGESAHSEGSSHRSPSQRNREGGSRVTPRYSGTGPVHVQNATTSLTHSAPQAGIAPYTYSFPVVKVAPQQVPSNLSVVSAPAPVVQRPEVVTPSSAQLNNSRSATNRLQPEVQGLRSTKSQRVRGASNNMRVKQLELRENHPGVVFT